MFITSFLYLLFFCWSDWLDLLISSLSSFHRELMKCLKELVMSNKTSFLKLCLGLQLQILLFGLEEGRLRGERRAAFHLPNSAYLPAAWLIRPLRRGKGYSKGTKVAKSVLCKDNLMKTILCSGINLLFPHLNSALSMWRKCCLRSKIQYCVRSECLVNIETIT